MTNTFRSDWASIALGCCSEMNHCAEVELVTVCAVGEPGEPQPNGESAVHEVGFMNADFLLRPRTTPQVAEKIAALARPEPVSAPRAPIPREALNKALFLFLGLAVGDGRLRWRQITLVCSASHACGDPRVRFLAASSSSAGHRRPKLHAAARTRAPITTFASPKSVWS